VRQEDDGQWYAIQHAHQAVEARIIAVTRARNCEKNRPGRSGIERL
jgi:hypothetical protein